MESTERSRLPRFKRAAIEPFVLTERDVEIVRLVYRYRLLRSDQVIRLLGDGHSEKKILARLQTLFHAKYLDRPRNQLGFVEGGGSRKLLHAPGTKGVELLADRREINPRVAMLDWSDKNRKLKARSFPHMLLVNDIAISVIAAVREMPEIEIIPREALIAQAPEAQRARRFPTGWHVRLDGIADPVSVYPDQMFALRYRSREEGRNRAFFFVEADTGTLSIRPTGRRQTNIVDKIRAYNRSWTTWDKAPELRPFGFSKFRVLFVTSSRQRVANMIERLRPTFRDEGGANRFLFVDEPTFTASAFFAVPWRNGDGAETQIPST